MRTIIIGNCSGNTFLVPRSLPPLTRAALGLLRRRLVGAQRGLCQGCDGRDEYPYPRNDDPIVKILPSVVWGARSPEPTVAIVTTAK